MSTVRSHKKIAGTVLFAVLALLGPALAPTSPVAAGAAARQAGDRIYDFPQHEKDAMRACVRRAHLGVEQEHGVEIPDTRPAYDRWYAANRGGPVVADWDRAFRHCQDTTLWTQGKWNWDSMVRVR